MKQNYLKGFTGALVLTLGAFGASAQVAQIGSMPYETLNEAFVAADEGAVITLLTDTEVTSMIPVTKTVTLDLNGKTITNNVEENRLFRMSGVTFTIDGNGGSVITPETNTKSYGFVDLRDGSGVASADAKLIINNATFNGTTDGGSLFKTRTHHQTIELTDVNVSSLGGENYGIVNAYSFAVNLTVKGGVYDYDSTNKPNAVFGTPTSNSVVNFDGVKVRSNKSTIVEVFDSEGIVENCDFTVIPGSPNHHGTAVAVSGNGKVTVSGGSYSGDFALYVFNSGGTITVDGGTFDGEQAAIKADNATNAKGPSLVIVNDGDFNGSISVDSRSDLNVNGGVFTADVTEYCASDVTSVKSTDAEGNPVYVVLKDTENVAALIGTTAYATLAEAFEAANEGETITLVKDVEVGAMIPVTKSLTLDLNGKTITNNVAENRLFRMSGVTFTIDGNGGSVITPETNTKSYGFVDLRDASGVASADAKLIISNASFEGATNGGSLFAFRTSGQSLDFENVNVNLTGGNTFSIINGYQCKVDVKVHGGEYVCNSTHPTAGVFQAGPDSTIDFSDVKVTTSVGPIFEVIRSNATFTNCEMTNTATNSYFAACISASNGADVTVNGGTYTANYPIYVYNSGGTITVEDGTFDGKIAAIKADNSTTASKSEILVSGGEFTGPIAIGTDCKLSISGGSYTDANASEYCANGYKLGTYNEATGMYDVVSDTSTGIENVAAGESEGALSGKVYNLQGICVGDSLEGLTRGIYVVNGRKVRVE